MSDTFPLVFSVTSGKGGVGKTNLSVNLALELAKKGKRVVLVDADLGLANVDVLLGLTPAAEPSSTCSTKGPESRIFFSPRRTVFPSLPASSGMSEMLTLSTRPETGTSGGHGRSGRQHRLSDCGYRRGHQQKRPVFQPGGAAAPLVVLTPEPTSLTDAYALIKVLKMAHGVEHFKICVNMAKDAATAKGNVQNAFIRPAIISWTAYRWTSSALCPAIPACAPAWCSRNPFCAFAPDSPAAQGPWRTWRRPSWPGSRRTNWTAISNSSGRSCCSAEASMAEKHMRRPHDVAAHFL